MANSTDTLVERWADAGNSHDVDRIYALFTDDAVYEDVPFGIIRKGDEVRELFASNFTTFGEDFRVDDVTGFFTETQGIIRWTMSGTQIGNLPDGEPSAG